VDQEKTCAPVKSESISVDEYHRRSKHSLKKYAKGPDGLDWDTQPDPYRRFDGSPRFSLPLPARNLIVDYNEIFNPQNIPPAIMDHRSLGALFELSLGLSAWKVYGTDRWALRVNPSSGNLHPTEAYLIFAGANIIPAGTYHYHSHDHCLEQRCNLKAHTESLSSLLDNNSFLIGLSSIHWREAWKYGERSYRYCQLDVGHAIAAIRYAAAILGWHVQLLDDCSDDKITSLLGLNRDDDFMGTEPETADVLLQIYTKGIADAPDIDTLVDLGSRAEWKGHANCLSPDKHIQWEVVEQISTTCTKPKTEPQACTSPDYPEIAQCNTDFDASAIVRQRRSAQAFDAETVIPLTALYRMLDALLPRNNTPPFDALCWHPRIHLVLFVHRVEGMKSGLYAFPRNEAGKSMLQETLRDEFDWTRPPICPETLPLYHLISANSQNAARTVSCHQAIASDGAFSVSMLAEFSSSVKDKPWQYKQLFWEAGILGQSLYLEAEAAGMRGTGMGCFFDDTVHEILGIQDQTLQVMYHFTVGTPTLDKRLISLPPYGHLNKSQ
jgi:SagB-type dehydrogenase family enzyme